MAGNSAEAKTTQTSAILRAFQTEDRQKILDNLRANTIALSATTVASMKATLNMPWYQLREMSRWLRTFDIKLAPEKKTRSVVEEWVGTGLMVEQAPLVERKDSSVSVNLTPWAYTYNLVAQVLRRLDQLKENGQLVHHSFLQNNIHVKIGGDHGGGSFKMSFQILNVKNPNRTENSIVFSIFEGKDTRANLRMCLLRFCSQVKMLEKVKWQEKKIQVFMFGDYQFLCYMYGLSGANGKR